MSLLFLATEPDEINKVITDSIKECFGKGQSLPKSQEELVKLCHFLCFYSIVEISERAQEEVDSLIGGLLEALTIKDLKPLDYSTIQQPLLQLRQLKGGGLIPGNRIHKENVHNYVTMGASVIVRHVGIGTPCKIVSWTPSYSIISCEIGKKRSDYSMSDLIFFDKSK